MEISKTQKLNDTRYNHTETTRYVVHPTSGYVHQKSHPVTVISLKNVTISQHKCCLAFSIFSADSLTESIFLTKLQDLANEPRYTETQSFRKCVN